MAMLVSTRSPYWFLAVLGILHHGSNFLVDGACKRIPRLFFPVTYDRKHLPAPDRFARVARGFRTVSLAESRQGRPFATIATHDYLLRFTLGDGGISSTVSADGCELQCCPYVMSQPFLTFLRGQGPTQPFPVKVDDCVPPGASPGYGTSYRIGPHSPPRVEHRHFLRWALPAISRIRRLHVDFSQNTHANCTRTNSGLAGAALHGCSERAQPHYRPALCLGPCSASSCLGFVDATPCAPTRQDLCSIESRPRLRISAGPPQGHCSSTDSQVYTAPFELLPGRPGVKGSVDATPTWSYASPSLEYGLRMQVLWSVVTTPRPSALALVGNSQAVCSALIGRLWTGDSGRSPDSLSSRSESGPLHQMAGAN